MPITPKQIPLASSREYGTHPVVPGYQFASDNAAGICPEAWHELEKANVDFAAGYGDDPWTGRATDLIRDVFEKDCDVFFAFNGTAANALALASLAQSYHSIICHELAHVETDECGAPEFFSNGTKLLPVGGAHGKLLPSSIDSMVTRRRDIHYPKPRVVSITQVTELSTAYSVSEIESIGEVCRQHRLALHMDGARFSNAVAALGVAPAEITWKAGVDVLCFGGTKNGMQAGEAIIFFDHSLSVDFAYRCKQAGQLASKMRFLSAPWVGMLSGGAWLEHAKRANAAAVRLEAGVRAIKEVEILGQRDGNALFVKLKPFVKQQLHAEGWRFYDFIGAGGSRLMCSWNTSDSAIDRFLIDLSKAAMADPSGKHSSL